MLPVDEQMKIITSGAAQIVPEADLRKKLEKGTPLNIKHRQRYRADRRSFGQEFNASAAVARADRGQCRDLRLSGNEDPRSREDHHRA